MIEVFFRNIIYFDLVKIIVLNIFRKYLIYITISQSTNIEQMVDALEAKRIHKEMLNSLIFTTVGSCLHIEVIAIIFKMKNP